MDSKTRDAISQAHAVAAGAAGRRRRLRRKTKPGNARRERELAAAIDALREAMAPIRRAVGRLPHAPMSARDEERLREASAALKYERKQIRKMQRG